MTEKPSSETPEPIQDSKTTPANPDTPEDLDHQSEPTKKQSAELRIEDTNHWKAAQAMGLVDFDDE